MDAVIKQGLLRKAANTDGRPLSSLFGKLDSNKWCVLAVRGGKPFFESYDKEEEMFTSSLSHSVDLSNCKQVTYTLSRRTKTYSFCLILPFKVIQLIASSREQLLSWVKSIETCLQKFGIIEARDDDHVYSFCPAVVNVKGHSKEDEEELLGAVGGSEVTEYATSDDIANLDEDGDEIFGQIGDKQIKDWQERVSDGDEKQPSRKISEKFKFDWTKEPTSEPKNEMEEVESRIEQEDCSGSCDFQDVSFWERNKVSDNSNDQDSNFDPDGEYCGITEFAQLRVRQSSNLPSTQNVISGNTKHANDFHPTEKLTVNLPQSNSCSTATPPISNSNENNYAPFPTRKPVPNLINFDDGVKPSNSDGVRVEEPLCPIPHPRKLSQSTPVQTLSDGNEIRNDHHSETLSVRPVKESRLTTNDNSENVSSVNNGHKSSAYSPPLPLPRRNQSKAKPEEQEENFYEGIFPPKDNVASTPEVPPRFDSLTLNNFPINAKRTSNIITSPSIDPDFDFSTDLRSLNRGQPSIPPLPPRNKIRSEEVCGKAEQPPLPVRNKVKSEELPEKQPLPPARKKTRESPPPIPTRSGSVRVVSMNNGASNNREPRRQLSYRMKIDKAESCNTVLSLKQNQIEILKEEILLPSVMVQIKKEHFQGLALVDSFSGVWVTGWNLVQYPRLHDKFHIGDKILSVNNVPCQTSASFYKQIKHSEYSVVDLQIKRLPKAKVFVMRRSAEGESIGIKREGGTAEIVYVDPDGLAGRHGLTLKAQNMLDNNICNWVITEINSLTLNLFFKDMEIEHRLGAVGKDITIVVQPSDLINDLKKQLKKMKNYKSYLIK